MKVIAAAGGFDPLHSGHISHFRAAKSMGDWLVVIVNSDANMIKKKGYCFMSQLERMEIVKALRYVDEVVPSFSSDGTVAESLRQIMPSVFAKGGDRTANNMPQNEVDACSEIGCSIVYGVGGQKIQSSSGLVERVKEVVK